MEQHGGKYCTVRFPTDEDMDRAFDTIIHDSENGFTGVDDNTIIINTDQCNMLEELMKNKQLNFVHVH
jgi:hypothetical protein